MENVWNQEHFKVAIFDPKSRIRKYNFEAMSLQFIAADFFDTERVGVELVRVIKNIDNKTPLKKKYIRLMPSGTESTWRMAQKNDNTHLTEFRFKRTVRKDPMERNVKKGRGI